MAILTLKRFLTFMVERAYQLLVIDVPKDRKTDDATDGSGVFFVSIVGVGSGLRVALDPLLPILNGRMPLWRTTVLAHLVRPDGAPGWWSHELSRDEAQPALARWPLHQLAFHQHTPRGPKKDTA